MGGMVDAAGEPVRRIAVRGCSGSGKTTLAGELARRLGVEHIELDGLFHQPGWQPRDHGEFRADVAERVAADGWVADGNYDSKGVQDVIAPRVQLVVWLDLPRWLVTARMVKRTVLRGALRKELWNGNRESLVNLFKRDPEDNILAWTWTQWPAYHENALAAADNPQWSHATVLRLTTPDQVADLLESF